MSKSIEEFLKYAESRMSEIEMYDALIKEAMYKEAVEWRKLVSRVNPLNYVRRVTNQKWLPTYTDVSKNYAREFLKNRGAGTTLDDLHKYMKQSQSDIKHRVQQVVGKQKQWDFGYKAPTKASPTPTAPGSEASATPVPGKDAPTTPVPSSEAKPAAPDAPTTPSPEPKPAGTEKPRVPGEEATKDPNLKWKAIGLGGIPASAALTWLGTSSSSDLEEQNDSLVQQVNDYQKQIQQMRDSAQVGDSFANMNFFERLLFLLLGPAMFKYMGSGSSNL